MKNNSGKLLKTLFIGPFSPPYTGDAVKNSYLKEGFDSIQTENIVWFDTICRKGNRLIHHLKVIPLMIISNQIILSLNKEGRYAIIRIFSLLKFFTNKRAVLYVVGGTFDRQLLYMSAFYRKLYIRAINNLDGIFAESAILKKGLEDLGVKNVEIVYNPRKDSGDKWEYRDSIKGKILFISRVTEVKGVTVLIDAFNKLLNENPNISLDIYGPIDEDYEESFMEKVKLSNGKIKFGGLLDPSEVQSTLANYHFLALPTFHFGEGLPGILVEAGMAGTPIVITRFNALPEFFEHNESALFVEPKDVEGLTQAMSLLINDSNLAKKISEGIKKVAEPFKIEHVIDQSLSLFKNYGWKINVKENEL